MELIVHWLGQLLNTWQLFSYEMCQYIFLTKSDFINSYFLL